MTHFKHKNTVVVRFGPGAGYPNAGVIWPTEIILVWDANDINFDLRLRYFWYYMRCSVMVSAYLHIWFFFLLKTKVYILPHMLTKYT